MKVLDLQCINAHVFEGWFASEADFAQQLATGLLACPVCGSISVSKKLSAPRLSLGHARDALPATQGDSVSPAVDQVLQTAWTAVARRILADTDDVGDRFAEEARKIHYGERPERGIRGQASREETLSLIEEGIEVMPLPLPESLKRPVQ